MLLEHIKLVCRKLFIDLPQFVAVWGKVEREGKEGGHKNKLYLFISICSTAYSGCLHSSWFRNTYVPRTAINGTTSPSLFPILYLNLTRTFHKSFESKYLHNIFDFILWSKQRETGKRTIVACFCISVCVCVYLQLLQQINML